MTISIYECDLYDSIRIHSAILRMLLSVTLAAV